MNKTNIAVIGVGYLGKFHAEKYLAMQNATLVALCDTSDDAKEFAQTHSCSLIKDYKQLLGKVDAVSIATPTPTHFEIAQFFLENNVHVLIEKPITTTINEADTLIAIAKANKLVLQVGHVERFNTALKAINPLLNNPRFIESTRLAPFTQRGSDVNVILDLMIHDIDLIQFMVNSEITNISATGASLVTPYIDIGNARLEFENGAVANVTASRISLKRQRKIRIFQNDAYISVDLDKKKFTCHQKKEGQSAHYPDMPKIKSIRKTFGQGDAIWDEISDFLNAIQQHTHPLVSGLDGRNALATAIKITKIMKEKFQENG